MDIEHSDLFSIYLNAVIEEEKKDCTAQVLKQAGESLDPDNPYLLTQAFAEALEAALSSSPLYSAAIQDHPENEAVLLQEFDRLQKLIPQFTKDGVLNLRHCRSEQRRQEHQRDLREAARLLKRMPPERILNDNLNHYVREARKALIQHFENDTLSFSFGRSAKRNAVPLSLTNCKRYLDRLQSEFPGYALNVLGCTSLFDYISRQIGEKYPVLARVPFAPCPDGQPYRDVLSDAVSSVSNKFWQSLRKSFNPGSVRACLKKNPNYQQMINTFENVKSANRALHAEVLQAIPETYKDLYPAARQMQRHFILHIGPTNSGKTHDSIQRLMEADSGVYLAPLRLLAYEQFENINRSGIPCSLLTGEEQQMVGYAHIQSSTIEMADLSRDYDIAVIDEAQMIADEERGGSWTACMLGLCADEIHICASPDAEKLLIRIIEDCGDTWEVVYHQRQTPLLMEKKAYHFPEDIRKGDAFIVFSKRDVHAVAAELQRRKFKCSIIYGALPYDVRHRQAELFSSGETDVVVATDAIGMGMNLPIRRIVFIAVEKYDGKVRRNLFEPEIRQIAGRAGRYGIYDEGYVTAITGFNLVKKALASPDIPLITAVIRFPETLLTIDAKLVDILERWDQIMPHSGWSKSSMSRMIYLARRLNQQEESNRFVYDFIMLPFDEGDSDLLFLWDRMVIREKEEDHLDVLNELPFVPAVEQCTIRDLDELERDYHLCDLLYNYTRNFLPDEKELLGAIDSKKYAISTDIMHILSTKRMSGKHCRICGRALAWNYPYGICERCHGGSFSREGGDRFY